MHVVSSICLSLQSGSCDEYNNYYYYYCYYYYYGYCCNYYWYSELACFFLCTPEFISLQNKILRCCQPMLSPVTRAHRIFVVCFCVLMTRLRILGRPPVMNVELSMSEQALLSFECEPVLVE